MWLGRGGGVVTLRGRENPSLDPLKTIVNVAEKVGVMHGYYNRSRYWSPPPPPPPPPPLQYTHIIVAWRSHAGVTNSQMDSYMDTLAHS